MKAEGFEYSLVAPKKVERRRFVLSADGEVLVKTAVVALCGMEKQYFLGQKPPEKMKRLPLVQGHEGCGYVLEDPSGNLKPGTLVSVISFWPCFSCLTCIGGGTNYCPNRKLMGSNSPGLIRSHFTSPSHFLQPVPSGVSPFIAAIAEPAAVAYHATKSVPQETVQTAVVGNGPLGYLLVATLSYFRHIPKNRLYFFGRTPEKLSLASDIAETVRIDGNPRQYENSFDFVFEAVGHPASVEKALNLTKPGGTCIILGTRDNPVPLPNGATIDNLTNWVNAGGEMEVNGRLLTSSSVYLMEDYPVVTSAMADSTYQALLARMINKNRIFNIQEAEDVENALIFYSRNPHIQKVFLVFEKEAEKWLSALNC